MKISEMIEVLQRAIYADGKCVNVEIAENRGNNWRKNDFPLWNFAHHNYRIKPEPKRVPLTMQDLIDRIKEGKTMWIKHNITNHIENIIAFTPMFVSLHSHIDSVEYPYLMELGTFLDGTPCYKEVEDE